MRRRASYYLNGKIKIPLVFPAQVRYNEDRAWMTFLPERKKRMMYQKGLRIVLRAVVCMGVMACLTGCGVSFGGFRPGGTKELVFSCNEPLPEEESGEAVSGARPADGQKEEREAAGEIPTVDTQDGKGPESSPESDGKRPEGGSESDGREPEDGLESDGKVDLNSAGLEELMTLNGIGETRAKAILEYREQNGPFTKEEDIMQVQGIKEGIYSKIQNQIVVH